MCSNAPKLTVFLRPDFSEPCTKTTRPDTKAFRLWENSLEGFRWGPCSSKISLHGLTAGFRSSPLPVATFYQSSVHINDIGAAILGVCCAPNLTPFVPETLALLPESAQPNPGFAAPNLAPFVPDIGAAILWYRCAGFQKFGLSLQMFNSPGQTDR